MHFWIDKRNCTYSGRHRMPSSLSAGVGRTRGRVGVGARKSMAAPVHRFTALDCPPRRPPRTHRAQSSAPIPTVHSSRRPGDNSMYVEMQPAPPQPTIASLAAARSVTPDTLLRTAALGLHQEPMIAPHLKFVMMVSFALATMVFAGAKIYFDRQAQVVRETGNSGDSGGAVVAGAAALAGIIGCTISMCKSRPHPPPMSPQRVSSTARRHQQLTQSEPSSSEMLSLTSPLSPLSPPSPPPPPYHIAVLLPPRDSSPPPPSYHNLR